MLAHYESSLINLLSRYTLSIVVSKKIKRKTMATYQEILRQFANLTPDEQIIFLHEIALRFTSENSCKYYLSKGHFL